MLNYLEIDHVITVQVSPSMVRVKAYKLLVKLWVFKLLGDGGAASPAALRPHSNRAVIPPRIGVS